MSVRDVEKYIKSMSKPAKVKKQTSESLKAVYTQMEEELKLVLGTKVSISAKGDDGVGKIEIEFYNHDDFERITELIKK